MFLRNGGNQFALRYEMGHTTMNMTQRYVKLVESDVEQQHRKASPVNTIIRNKPTLAIKRGPAKRF
jgi:hypothetical protein